MPRSIVLLRVFIGSSPLGLGAAGLSRRAGPVFDQGVAALPLVRELDDTRMVFLNSGCYVSDKTIANPGVHEWESTLADIHPYQPVPHRF